MSENKNVDGIIKMSKKELEKSRKLVLDSIEEEMRAPKKEKIPARPRRTARNVDGIVKKARDKIKDNSIAGKLKSKKFEKIQQKSIISAPETGSNKNLESASNKIADVRQRKEELAEKARLKKVLDDGKDRVLRELGIEEKTNNKVNQESNTKPISKISAEESEIKEKLKKKAKLEAENTKKMEKIEKKEKKKEKEELRKKKIQLKEEKKKNRKEKAERRKKELKNKYNIFVTRTMAAGKRTLFYLVLFTVSFLLIYSLFAILLLKLNVDTKATRYIARYLPVPAIIADSSVVEYYTYKDIKLRIVKMSGSADIPDETVKLMLIKNLIINNLARKYNLAITESLIDDINKRIIYDSDANFVSITRIMKIKKLIDAGEDFIRTSTRLGDSLGTLTLNEDNKNNLEFYGKLTDLKKNKSSDIIIDVDGYYIYHVFRKVNNTIDLSYVKIDAKLLDDYLNETIRNYKLWSLVN